MKQGAMALHNAPLHCLEKTFLAMWVIKPILIGRDGFKTAWACCVWIARITGFFQHLGDASKRMIQTGQFDQLAIDHLTDHAPINYCIHIWNNLHQVSLEA